MAETSPVWKLRHGGASANAATVYLSELEPSSLGTTGQHDKDRTAFHNACQDSKR